MPLVHHATLPVVKYHGRLVSCGEELLWHDTDRAPICHMARDVITFPPHSLSLRARAVRKGLCGRAG